MNRPEYPEIGRELKWHELQTGSIVVLWAAHKPRVAITVWVHRVMPDLVLFGMGEILGPPQRVWAKAKPRERRAPIGYYPQQDGTLKDIWDHTIQMFEYLGPPIKKEMTP